jgi:hypothetical protein
MAEAARSQVDWCPAEQPPADAVMVLVKGGVAHRRDGRWWTVTGEEWPGRPIEWDVHWWAPMPSPPAEPPQKY